MPPYSLPCMHQTHQQMQYTVPKSSVTQQAGCRSGRLPSMLHRTALMTNSCWTVRLMRPQHYSVLIGS